MWPRLTLNSLSSSGWPSTSDSHATARPPAPVLGSQVFIPCLWISRTQRDHLVQNHCHHYAQKFDRIFQVTLKNLQNGQAVDANPQSFPCSMELEDPCRQRVPLQLIGGWFICGQKSDLNDYETILCQLVWIFTCFAAEISISFIRGSAPDSVVSWSCPFWARRSRLLNVCRCH